MSDRITYKRLAEKAESMGKEFGLRLTIDCAYGGYRLCRINTPGSGEYDLTGRMTSRQLMDTMIAMCEFYGAVQGEPERRKRETETQAQRKLDKEAQEAREKQAIEDSRVINDSLTQLGFFACKQCREATRYDYCSARCQKAAVDNVASISKMDLNRKEEMYKKEGEE